MVMDDLNINVNKQNHTLSDVLEVTGTKNLVKGPTYFENLAVPTTLDLVIKMSRGVLIRLSVLKMV